MVSESRPLQQYLPLRLIRTPPWRQHRNHAYPLFRSASFVVYICVPSVNSAVASSFDHHSLPTHHMVSESRPLQQYLPLRLIRTPPWRQQRNHAYPLFRSASFVVYICVPSVNYAVASSFDHHSLPTHPYGVGESTSTAIPPTSTHQDTSMATATQPCLSIVS